MQASAPDVYDWQDSDTLKLCLEISTRLDSLTDAINHLSAWRLEALQAGFMPANFLTELTVVAAAISRCKSQVRMPVASLLRQVQSLLSGSAFPSKLESELRGKIDLNRHMDQLRAQVASLEIQVSKFSSRRAELVASKWERLSLALLADSRDAFSSSVRQDMVPPPNILTAIPFSYPPSSGGLREVAARHSARSEAGHHADRQLQLRRACSRRQCHERSCCRVLKRCRRLGQT